jgi:uncharacterized protein
MNALRRVTWTLGAPVRATVIGGILLYRATLSGWLGGQCRFYPTCSHYGEDAIRAHGAVRGSAIAAWRIMRCNPFGRGGLDPVRPASKRTPNRVKYDDILRSTARRPAPGRSPAVPQPGEEAHA